MTATIRPPACTAQYTDTTNTWGCSGRHIDGWHTVTGDGGLVEPDDTTTTLIPQVKP